MIELWAETDQQEVCSVCSCLRYCVRVVDASEQTYVVAICGLCMATALEALTDQRYVNLYNAWSEARKWRNQKRVYRRKLQA